MAVMGSLCRLSGSLFLFLSLVYLLNILSAPWPVASLHATHYIHKLPNGVIAPSYHPESHFEIFGSGIEHPLSRSVDAERPTTHDAAVAFLHLRHKLANASLVVHSSHAGHVTDHVYLHQRYHGIPVANAVANVAFNKAGRIVSYGSSLVSPSSAPVVPTPKLTESDAIAAAIDRLGGVSTKDEAPLEYLALDDGRVVLTRSVQLTLHGNGHLVEAFVDAETGAVRAVNGFTSSLTMRVLPFQKQTLAEGFETLVDPEDRYSSPEGWTSLGGVDSGNTSGNNAISLKYSTIDEGVTTQSAPGEFIFPLDARQDPRIKANLDAARTNAFYVVNTFHDIMYRYGFTEAAFNFQEDNYGRGGQGQDRVIISVQDNRGTNNAHFATPPDGTSGVMTLFLWNDTIPIERDSALENDVIVHESTHGLTNRLTGGGTGRCLQSLEAQGLGEGWSDAVAEWSEHKDATIRDWGFATYLYNNTKGIRTDMYSTNPVLNPLTYAFIPRLHEARTHAIGEIWGNVLHNVYAALLEVHGFIGDARTNADSTDAQAVFLHLLIDALMLQPCNPTFLYARHAWIQADINRFAGANVCILWRVFASKGMGFHAVNYYVNNFDVPAGC